MQIVDITKDNIAAEHICCAIAAKKGDMREQSKKSWMLNRFGEGLVFKRLDARGKAFIEYIPAESAWCPMEAPGAMFIDCFWVAGALKGQGHGTRLLEACIADSIAKGKTGLVAVVGAKKTPFLSDGKFLKARGFAVADTAKPNFELLHLPLAPDATSPRILPHAKEGRCEGTGAVLYVSHQCPHTSMYVPLIEAVAASRGFPFRVVWLANAKEAQASPALFTTYALFMNGEFVTNEILSEKKFEALLESQA